MFNFDNLVFKGGSETIRYFVTKKVKYIWKKETQEFLKLK